MSHKPIFTPIVEIKIPQDANDSSHVRRLTRLTPEKLEAERQKRLLEHRLAQEQKWAAILLASNVAVGINSCLGFLLL
jgi:hypothetical protein